MATKQPGFTLIELMIVVAIIAILAALAVPFYNYYMNRTKMGEVLTAFSTCKTAVSEAADTGLNTLATTNGFGCESPNGTTQYIASITTDDTGTITIVPRNIISSVDGKPLSLIPYSSKNNKMTRNDFLAGTQRSVHSWHCQRDTNNPIPAVYLPADCR